MRPREFFGGAARLTQEMSRLDLQPKAAIEAYPNGDAYRADHDMLFWIVVLFLKT